MMCVIVSQRWIPDHARTSWTRRNEIKIRPELADYPSCNSMLHFSLTHDASISPYRTKYEILIDRSCRVWSSQCEYRLSSHPASNTRIDLVDDIAATELPPISTGLSHDVRHLHVVLDLVRVLLSIVISTIPISISEFDLPSH